MTDEFITKGLESNRYLKAAKLIERFETELRRELRQAGDAIVAENNELFVDGENPNWNRHISSSGGVLAFARFDYPMARHHSETGDRFKLNLAMRWIEPRVVGYDRDGVMTIVGYKIKNAPEADYRRVQEETRNGHRDVHAKDDPHGNYPGEFQVPVQDIEDVRAGYERLKKHFSEFGSTFGVEPES